MHETFLRVQSEARRVDCEISDVRGWLCGWVAKLALGDHRQSARWRHLSAVDIAKDTLRRGPTESAAEREARPVSPRVVTALARLRPAQRRSMQLRYLDGLPAEAAAEVAGCTAKAIVQNCVMARRWLRAELPDLAPTRTSWVQDVSKADAVRAAFDAVGQSDVSAVLGWLRERGVSVQDSYVYAIRKGHRGAVADPSVQRAPELQGLSKADAVRTAFGAVGSSDVSAVLGWLRERGVTVGGPYVYAVREGRYQRANTEQPTQTPTPIDQHRGTAAVDTDVSTSVVVPEPRDQQAEAAAPGTVDETARAVARARESVARVVAERVSPPVIGGPCAALVVDGTDNASIAREGIESWELVRAVQGGDREAFARLYERYLPQVRGFLRGRVADAGLVEDLTSETFLRALRGIGTLTEQRADPGAWLSTIARNLVFDHAKSARARREWVTDEVPEPRSGFSSEPSVEEQAQARDDRAGAATTVARCLDTLTPDQRHAVRLYDLSPARSMSEAATVMGRTPGAVKALRHRGVQAMREQLTGEGLSSSHDCLDAAMALAGHECAGGQHTPAEGAIRGRDDPGEATHSEDDAARIESQPAVDEPAVDETAVAVARAREAVAQSRRPLAPTLGVDEAERAEELTRWRTDDQAVEDEACQDDAAERGDWASDRCAELEGSLR